MTNTLEMENGYGNINQVWYCENCETAGMVGYDPSISAKAEIELISKDHRKVSPKCRTGDMLVRLVKS